MENPEKEIAAIMQSLASFPKFDIQEQVIRTYFSPHVCLYHPYCSAQGIDDLISLYHIGGFFAKYREMEILDVLYDSVKNRASIHTRISVWPWQLMKPRHLNMMVLLELEDFNAGDGRVLKKIKVQRDFFFISSAVATLPLIGDLYSMEWVRFYAGHAYARTFAFLKKLALAFFPKGVQQLGQILCWDIQIYA